jgi:hypothetical protein
VHRQPEGGWLHSAQENYTKSDNIIRRPISTS